MADAPNTMATLNGMFKTVYGDKIIQTIPDFAILQKRIAFDSGKELGAEYKCPVNLAHEAGFSYMGEAGLVGDLSDAVAGVMKEATVKGTEVILKTQLSYKTVSAASQKGQKAFAKATAWKVNDMNEATRKRLEVSFLYGQKGVGTVESVTANGSDADIVVTAATWAGGIWSGAEGALLDAYTTVTKNNASGVLKILKVDSDNRKLTCSFTGTLGSEVAAGDVLYFKGTNTSNGSTASFNEMAGLQAIISNTGTLFGIDASTYSLWKGNVISNVGALSFGKIQAAVAKAVNKGLMEKALMLVSPAGWTALNTDLSALRMFDSSYKGSKIESGAESLLFHSTNGSIEVVSHPLVKDGDAFIVPEESILRVGSTDVTFSLPGTSEEFFIFRQDKNAIELQCMADEAIFIEKPAHAIYMTGITYA